MAFARQLNYSFAAYLDLEQVSQTKHEFFDGEIFAMAGGTPEHAALGISVGGLLLAQAVGTGYTVYSSDLRVRVTATGLATYPDITVVCGPRETDPESSSTVINPSVLVEVVSESTERYDRGEKFEHYKKIPTAKAIVFVSQTERKIDVWQCGADAWQLASYGPSESAKLGPLPFTLDVDRVYSVMER